MSWRGDCREEVTKRHLSCFVCFCFVFVEFCVVPLVRVTIQFGKWESSPQLLDRKMTQVTLDGQEDQ